MNFRRLTDQPKDEKSEAVVKQAIKGDIKPELRIESVPTGNIALLPVFKRSIEIKSEIKQEPDIPTEENGASTEIDPKLVMHKGCLVDVDKLLDQLNRSEKAREKTEELLVELRKNYTELKTSNTKAKDKVKVLQADLSRTEQSLSSANVRHSRMPRIS